jgi:hypothetical protein
MYRCSTTRRTTSWRVEYIRQMAKVPLLVNPWKVSLPRLTPLTLADNAENELDHERDDLVLG